jgi:integral membrane protein
MTTAVAEPTALRALRVVALVETCSFAILLVCSVLKRTTSFNAVPVMGPIHGVLFLGLVVLVLLQYADLGWSALKTLLVLTIGSPLAHFFVRSTRTKEVL